MTENNNIDSKKSSGVNIITEVADNVNGNKNFNTLMTIPCTKIAVNIPLKYLGRCLSSQVETIVNPMMIIE